MVALLAQIPQSYGTTIGLEVDLRAPNPDVALELYDATIEDVLNAIVKAKPAYGWRKSGDSLAIYPRDRTSPLLDTVIASFQVTNVDDSDAINQLLILPEVQAKMIALNLYRVDGADPIRRNNKRISIRLAGVTMRQALDTIATESGSRFWVFQRTGERGEFLSLSTS